MCVCGQAYQDALPSTPVGLFGPLLLFHAIYGIPFRDVVSARTACSVCRAAHSSLLHVVRRRQPISNERQITKAGILFVRKFFFLRKLGLMCINSVAKTALQKILHIEKLTYLHTSKIQRNAKQFLRLRQQFCWKTKMLLVQFLQFLESRKNQPGNTAVIGHFSCFAKRAKHTFYSYVM